MLPTAAAGTWCSSSRVIRRVSPGADSGLSERNLTVRDGAYVWVVVVPHGPLGADRGNPVEVVMRRR